MSQLRILIVEDNSLVAEDIGVSLEDIGYCVVDKVKTGKAAIDSARKNSPDLILMDINLNGAMSGIEAAAEIQKFLKLPIIYLTAYADDSTYDEAKRTNPYAYITKPFDEKDLGRAIDLAIHCFSINCNDETKENLEVHYVLNDAIFIKVDKRFIKIPVNSITYLEAKGSYTKLHTDVDDHILTMNLHSFESKIQHPNLMRIHRSYIVNLNKVESFERNFLIIGKTTFTISKQYQQEFMDRFMTT